MSNLLRESVAPCESGPCTILSVLFDFENKTERPISPEEWSAGMAAGGFVWVDIFATDTEEASRTLRSFAIQDDVIAAILAADPVVQHARYDAFLHLVMTGFRLHGEDALHERIDVLIGERFLLTVHRSDAAFLRNVRRDYHGDFVRFAKSPSFLLYELWDHLLENYLTMQRHFEERVGNLHEALRGEVVDEAIFAQISELGAAFLQFRKTLLSSRMVLAELSTRRSVFVSEGSQVFLGNMVGTIDHMLQDLLVDRDILKESLNLYMSVVAFRTNRIMNRLTVVSVMFLPLTFLVGVYGMNFDAIPELHWRFGYVYFWVLVVAIAGGVFLRLRHTKLI